MTTILVKGDDVRSGTKAKVHHSWLWAAYVRVNELNSFNRYIEIFFLMVFPFIATTIKTTPEMKTNMLQCIYTYHELKKL